MLTNCKTGANGTLTCTATLTPAVEPKPADEAWSGRAKFLCGRAKIHRWAVRRKSAVGRPRYRPPERMRAAWTTAAFFLISSALGLSFKAPTSLPVGQPITLAALTDDYQAIITSDRPDLIEVVGNQLLVKRLTPSGVTVTLRAQVGHATFRP